MKKSAQILTVISLVASSLLFSTSANAAVNDLTTITPAQAVALLTAGSSDIDVVEGSEVAYGSMKSFTSVDLSPGFDLPQAGIFLNTDSQSLIFGSNDQAEDNSSNGSGVIRDQLDAILFNAGAMGYMNEIATTTNVSSLSFDFETTDPSIVSLEIDFMFASMEYFNSNWDIAAVIVDGVNYAFLPNGTILRVRPEANLCNFNYDPENNFGSNIQNPDPVCQNVIPNGNYNYYYNNQALTSLNGIVQAAAPAARIGALLDPELETHSITFAVADTTDEIVPSYLMFSLVQGSVQTFSGFGGIIEDVLTVPDAPTSLVAQKTGKRSAIVTLNNSAYNGGSAITSYTITSTPGGLTKTFELSGPQTITYEFLNLEPNTSYTFAATATNEIGTSDVRTSNTIKTDALVFATLSSLTFTDDGTGTGGKIVWGGKNIDAVLYTGPANSYPGPFNYGAYTGGWNGLIRNLTPDTEYTISIHAVSADGVGGFKSLTFKTSAALPVLTGAASAASSRPEQMSTQMPKVFAWIDENAFLAGEALTLQKLLKKFDSATVSNYSAFLKLPFSSVVDVKATSSTPSVCKVEAKLTVRSIAAGTCTISYTVTGGSRAPATMVKDFVFKKFS
jgi:hypothetical protein